MLKWATTSHLKCFVTVMVILAFAIILILVVPRNQLLTNDEINTLISEIEIEPISINDIGDVYTVIVYKTAKSNNRSALIAYKNKWDKIKTRQYAFYESNRANKVNVEYWTTAPYKYDLIGYVGVEVLDKEVFNKVRSAEVVLDNGLVIRASFQNSNILLIPTKRKYFWEKPQLKTIELYDSNGDVIDGFYYNN